jgi:uncharacterized protein YkwD
MNYSNYSLALFFALSASSLSAQAFVAVPAAKVTYGISARVDGVQTIQPDEQQLLGLANAARAAQGLAPLQWDPALASSALAHCTVMAANGQLSHQFAGEAELAKRAGNAGAHFSLIEENVAAGYHPADIHLSWMNSPGHRANLLNPEVDRVGIAVVATKGWTYAVENFAQVVPVMSQNQVEAAIANLMQRNGITVQATSTGTRAACALDSGMPVLSGQQRAGFIMRWQAANLTLLPQALLDRIATAKYSQATVGSCPVQGDSGPFTDYRIAVVLLRPATSPSTAVLIASGR